MVSKFAPTPRPTRGMHGTGTDDRPRTRDSGSRLRRAPRDAQALVAGHGRQPHRAIAGGATGRSVPTPAARARRRSLGVHLSRGSAGTREGHGHRRSGEDVERHGPGRPNGAPRRTARLGDAAATESAVPARALYRSIVARLPRG